MKTTPPRWYRDPQPLDIGQLYADLRAMGCDHEIAVWSLNHALGLTGPPDYTARWRIVRPLDFDDFLRGAGLL